jgi:hypothetical protein
MDNPAAGLGSVAGDRMGAAIRAGVAQDQAERAGTAFSEALTRQMARGVPVELAMARAESAFQAEASVPPPRTPADAAARSFASGGSEVARSLENLTGARTTAGNAALERAMAAAMARGAPLEDALAAATAAVRASETAAAADASPQATLAGATEPAQIARTLPSNSPAFDRALSALLSRGVAPVAALERARQAARAAADNVAADARNPVAVLASAMPPVAGNEPMSQLVSRALGAALSKGLSVEQAMARAAEIAQAEKAADQADASSPDNIFVRPAAAADAPARSPVFDQALAVALARGASPAQALQQAQRSEAAAADPAPPSKTALASGQGLASVLPEGRSKVFRTALNSALARGVPLQQAVASARRAEAEGAFRLSLPASIAGQLGKGATVNITTADGKPLPSWLTFDARRSQFVAVDVPDGGLPLPVAVEVGGKRLPVTVTETPVRR